jgi:hypothetical protein
MTHYTVIIRDAAGPSHVERWRALSQRPVSVNNMNPEPDVGVFAYADDAADCWTTERLDEAYEVIRAYRALFGEHREMKAIDYTPERLERLLTRYWFIQHDPSRAALVDEGWAALDERAKARSGGS